MLWEFGQERADESGARTWKRTTGPQGGVLNDGEETRSMRDLSTYRQDWEERRVVEGRLLRSMTIAESVAEMKSLYRRCKQQLADDDALFLGERVKFLTEMQSRLQRLDRYMERTDLGRSV